MMRKFEVGETIWVNLGCRCKWTYYAKEGDLIMDFDDDHQGGKKLSMIGTTKSQTRANPGGNPINEVKT